MSDRSAATLLLLLLLCVFRIVRGADHSVLCVLASSCLLPCPFDPGPEVVVHWLTPPEDGSSVHSFYHNTDQLGRQRLRYRGRTELFKDEILKGNASLLLSGVQLQDRGRYRCYTSTTKGSNEDFINVDVQAPVSQVSIDQEGDRLVCSSERIYPRPNVVWTPSTEPKTTVSPSEQGLFNVESSITLTESVDTYSCNISTEHSWRSATYRRTEISTSSGSRTEVFCAETTASIKSLVWTFNRTQNILERTESNIVYSRDWESRLEKVPGSTLVLKDLSRDLQGLYSCELKTDLSTYLTVTEVTVEEAPEAAGSTAGKIAGGIFGGIFAVAAAAILAFFLYRHLKTKQRKPQNTNCNGDNTTEATEKVLLNDAHDKAFIQNSGSSDSPAVD